jgi:hypothetical protein
MGFDFSEKCLHLNRVIDHNGPKIGLYPKVAKVEDALSKASRVKL